MSVLSVTVGALFVAFLFTLVSALILRPAPSQGLPEQTTDRVQEASSVPLWLFSLLFLFIWAGALWITPVGPMYWGVPWVPLIFLGLFGMFLLSGLAMLPTQRDTSPEKNSPEAAAFFGATLWVILGLLMIAVIIGIATGPNLISTM